MPKDIEYVNEKGGVEHWKSVAEVFEKRAIDAEHQAVMLRRTIRNLEDQIKVLTSGNLKEVRR